MRKTAWLVAVAGWAFAGCTSPEEIHCGGGTHLEGNECVVNGDGGSDAADGRDGTDVPHDITEEAGPPWGARLHGIVWGPNHMFPVSGAMVAAYVTEPGAIDEAPYCEPCVEPPVGVSYAISAADGSFEMQVLADRDYFLTTQKGQFRRVRTYHSPATEGDYDVDEALTTLPSRDDATLGDTIPNIALVYGDYDAIQDVFAKAGLGDEDGAYGLDWGTETGVFAVFDNSMPGSGSEHHGRRLNELLYDPAELHRYHVIFFACSYNANFDFMEDTTVQNNLRQWVRDGGKLYVSDFAYAVADMVWPEFIWFDDLLHGGCVENQFPDGCNHGPPFDTPSRANDAAMSDWLFAVDPTTTGSPPTALFETKENWDTIGQLHESYVGDDFDGAPVSMLPKSWIEGHWNYTADNLDGSDYTVDTWDYDTWHPLTVSWPFGCGRVLFTTYHTVGSTSGGRHPGFYTQELVLWYLIMEIQVCQDEILL